MQGKQLSPRAENDVRSDQFVALNRVKHNAWFRSRLMHHGHFAGTLW